VKIFEATSEGSEPVDPQVRDALLQPFVEATRAALGEMAGAEVAAHAPYRTSNHGCLGDVAALVALTSATPFAMVLSFPEGTAWALAKRILAESTKEVDENLVLDCVGEVANVIAGQAKALLAATAYEFAFSLPRVLHGAGAGPARPGQDRLVIAFTSECGEFALELFVKA
jgi:chemotaxis protein CheX